MKTKTFYKTAVWLCYVFLLMAGSATVSGETGTPESFPEPDVEIYLENGVWDWFESDLYIKELSKTEAWKDLPLSDPYINLMTLGTRLEKDLKIPMGETFVKELLKSPMEILLWDVFEHEKKTAFFVALDIKPGYEHLLKLGQAYTKSFKNSTSVNINNLQILQTNTSGETIFHVVKDNQLLLANHPQIFQYLPVTAEKGKKVTKFRSSTFFAEHMKKEKGNLKIRVNLLAWLKNLNSVLDKKFLHLGINITTGKFLTYESITLKAEPGFEPGQKGSMTPCLQWIPKTPAFSVSGAFRARHFLELFWNLPMVQAQKEQLGFDLETGLAPMFGDRFFVYVDSLQTTETPHIINGAMGFSLNGLDKNQQEKVAAFVRWVMEPENLPMKKETAGKKEKEVTVYRFEAAERPAFCVSKDFLIVGSGYLQLMKSVDVYHKKIPSLSDSKAYGSVAKEMNKEGFFHLYFRPSVFYGNLGEHMMFSAKSANDFNSLDVEKKILPMLNVLKKMSPAAMVLDGVRDGSDKHTLKGKIGFGNE